MNFFKKYYLVVVGLFAIIGITLLAHSNNYEISAKTIEFIKDGKVCQDIIHQIQPKSLYLSVTGQVFLSFSIATFISLFFIRSLEDEDRKKWTDIALNIQEKTSKDAIESLFKRIIDDRFFTIIKEDLLSAKIIRKHATWKYDITKDGDKLLFRRIITYKLHNISTSPTVETLKPTMANSSHCTGRIVKCVVEKGKKEDECNIDIENVDGYSKGSKNITIDPGEDVSVVMIMDQEFTGSYIFETHFTQHPIINLDIIVNHPSDYDFVLQSSFSSKCRLKINEDGVKKYNVIGGIFKGQGVEFLCEPKKITV